MKYKIYNQDVMEWAEQYQKGKFHALLCDAPYHLTSIVKRFGKKGSAPAKHGTDGVFSRSSKGFMGQQWDGGDIAFRPETWEALGEHLYPGAFGMCFSASRNWHRLAVAIEDAGFIIHPTIFGWLNGQGFPKATRVKEHTPCPTCNGRGTIQEKYTYDKTAKDWESAWGSFKWIDVVCPNCNGKKENNIFDGHRYGLQALKPAVEPIIVFQKPYEGKPLNNIIETGAGAIYIDGGRIPTNSEDIEKFKRLSGFNNTQSIGGNGMYQGGEVLDRSAYDGTKGRWPANFILDESSAERLDTQTGVLTSGKPSGKKHADNNIYGKYKNEDIDVKGIGDSGGASRFFYNVQEQIDEADPIYYCGKVSPKERNAGLDELDDIKMAVSGGAQAALARGEDYGNENSVGYDRIKVVKNNHPTVKPIALAKYLATLLLPPIEYAPRRILVPFSGVMSEAIGAALAGWEHIVGIEFDTENGYVDIAHKRMDYWSNK